MFNNFLKFHPSRTAAITKPINAHLEGDLRARGLGRVIDGDAGNAREKLLMKFLRFCSGGKHADDDVGRLKS